MSGILYIVGTPIGNLEDITLRALKILQEVDLIAAEDTRHTLKLLNYYNIKKSLTSYHEHNKILKGQKLIEELQSGKNIALVTDAGMPGISDPGEDIIKLCYLNNIKVTTVPGPVALISAIILSGISTRRYVFEGFLPKDKKKLKNIVDKLKLETRTIILYESPHQLAKTLIFLYKNLGDRNVSIVREITKQYEEVLKINLKNSSDIFLNREIKGEIVIVIEGIDYNIVKRNEIEEWETISVFEHLQIYLNENLEKKDAIKKVAKDRGLSKRDIYNFLEKTEKN